MAFRISAVLASDFETALNLIVKHHGNDVKGLSHTLESLKHIATRLNDEPHNVKYRRIRMLNKTFWERVGRVDGGIPFMTALGFDIVDQGELCSVQSEDSSKAEQLLKVLRVCATYFLYSSQVHILLKFSLTNNCKVLTS